VDPPDLAGQLCAAIGPALGGGVRVDGVTRMPGGASRETWSFAATLPDGTVRRLVLRRDRRGGPASGLLLEAGLMAAAGRAGVPVPSVVAAGDGSAGMGAPFVVMDYVEGETIPRRILRDEGLAPARSVLAAQCGRVLAAVHRMAPAEVPGLVGGDPLEHLRGLLDRLGQPHPAFELGLRWLAEDRPPRSGSTVVHGDFRLGNLVVGPAGIRAVLDWELAHLGDPLEDLGWLCVKAWRFGAPAVVGGFGTVEELVAGYRDAGGGPVDPGALHWWQVLGTVRWGVICIVQALTHMSGAQRSVELAAIGRRVCEVEWDVLEMLP
jgi:aminoglycoside phosphotransferase (APT) family kinase protein